MSIFKWIILSQTWININVLQNYSTISKVAIVNYVTNIGGFFKPYFNIRGLMETQ